MTMHDRFVGPVLPQVVSGPRPGRMRDRRGRGRRGPVALPGPLSPDSVPVHRSPREVFDALVAGAVRELEPHFAAETEAVEVVVEEAPLIPPGWDDRVPTSIVAHQQSPVRLVLYRLPLAQACRTDAELEDAVWTALVDGLSEIWHVPPEAIDPR